MKIVADAHIPFVKEYFQTYGELILKPGREIEARDVENADILLVRSITHVDEQLLQNSQIKFVGSVTAGADHLDTKWLDRAGIQWSIAAGFNAPPVADYVVSVIASLQRKQLFSNEKIRVAIVGVGHVGRLVVQRLQIFNFEIILCDPLRAMQEKDFISTPLDELTHLDLISFHVPLTQTGEFSTYHFIDKNFLKRQKQGCILLNASRGAIIHSQDLMEYGKHLIWCLDVWENEPHINKALLEQTKIATPHIAGYSKQSKIRGVDMIYRSACEKKILAPQAIAPITIPQQELSFAGANHYWQDIVLGIFNPLIMTAMMRTTLLPAKNESQLFDAMRNQFNYRYEFAYTKIFGVNLPSREKDILEKLGIEVI